MPDVPANNVLLNHRYRLLAIIAGGGMATVYKAQDTQLNRVVAVKTLRDTYAGDPTFVQRFREEAQAAAGLNHPNIVTVYDVGHDVFAGVDRQYIVMEFVAGQDLKHDLRDRIATGKRFAIDEAVDIARQVCEGVGAAHRHGVAHCDLKPQNIIITPEGTAKVTDFGISRAYTSLVGEKAETVWGTPQYYAPEQASGIAPNAGSDVYSIGIILFEMLAGRLPFDSKNGRELAQLHLTAEPPELHKLNPSVSLQLESIVRRALSKDPANRYRDASQFGRILGSYLDQGREQTISTASTIGVPATTVTKAIGSQPVAVGGTIPLGNTSARPRPIGQAGQSQPQRVIGRHTPVASTPTSDAAGVTSASIALGATTGGTPIVRLRRDAWLWLLGAVAFVCVLGLIPVYLADYRAYTVPPGQLATVTALPVKTVVVANGLIATPSKSLAIVPALSGLTLDVAQQRAALAGLQINVVTETLDATITQTVIGEQLPIANSQVAPGTLINVSLRRAPPNQQVPLELAGRIFDDTLSKTLTAVGWSVVLSNAFSMQPEKYILATDPRGGAMLSVSGTLTLTLSTGGRADINATFAVPIVLDSVTLRSDKFSPGLPIDLDVKWRATGRVTKDYKVFVHLLENDQYALVTQDTDREPRNHGSPSRTSTWVAGQFIQDNYTLVVPANQRAGKYRIAIGLYQEQQPRVTVISGGKAPEVIRDSVVVRTIEVVR